MTTNKIIIVSIVGLAVIGVGYYFFTQIKKGRGGKSTAEIQKTLEEECSKSGGNWDEATKTCKPKLVLTAEQIKVLQGLPNFTKF